MMDFKEIVKEVLQTEADELLRAISFVDDEIDKVVEIIYNTKGKLIVTGVGKSGLVGSKLAATFASTGTSSFFIHPTEAMHGDLGMIDSSDTVLAISYSGESAELLSILPHLKRFDIPLIAMARSKDSTLGKYADAYLSIDIEKEACPLGVAPTSSTTLTMAIGDAIAVCLMKKRDFQKEDFASFHPGGSLGKQLFIKLKDIMRVKNLPIISSNTSLQDAIQQMSKGRLGTVLIEKDGRLSGLISDGDLRRAMLESDFSLNNKAIKYANQNPKSIDDENMLASDALKLIEENKMQLLIIVDKQNHISGVVHIHDLVEMGIK
ncbi:MAG TPA: KpsF/GutQ family sugar-phosphate isomerase [Campylobacterales bacterium]|nr:KpsF/GutQ family sugar-phosphate isomerase [Campylobacterales bacterium]